MGLNKSFKRQALYNMIQTINFSQFCDGFSDTYKNNFSYEDIIDDIQNKTPYIPITDYKGDKLDNFIILQY